MDSLRAIGLITARGGSKGLPRKNIRPLAGKPLIAWTIEAALNSRQLDRVIVSTDSEEIAQVAQAWGAEVPFLRPAELAQDHSDHLSVAEHAIRWLEANDHICPNYLLLLQPTSPFRTAADIVAAVDIARQHNAIAVIGVTRMKTHPFQARQILADGTLGEIAISDVAYMRRQALPPVYAINGAIYLNRVESLLRDRTFFPQGAYPYIMPTEHTMDIDTAWDLYVADLIMRNPFTASLGDSG